MSQEPVAGDGKQTYDAIADKIGGVPNVRLKDNVAQGIAVAVITVAAAVTGYVMAGPGDKYTAVCVGALVGLVGGGILSGLVLMVVGLVRKR